MDKIRKISRHERCDNKFRLLVNLQEKAFHQNCYKTYVHKNNVAAAAKELKESKKSASKRTTRSTVPSIKEEACASNVSEPMDLISSDSFVFEFQEYCIFCKGEASQKINDEKKKKGISKNLSCKISNPSTLEKIMEAGKDPKHSFEMDQISNWLKVSGHKDLLEAGARYHVSCYSSFVTPESESDKMYQKVLNFIVKYIDDHPEENIMSLQHIVSEFSSDCTDLTALNIKYIKKMLSCRLQDDIFIASNRSGHYLLWRRDIGADHSFEIFNKSSHSTEEEKILEVANIIRDDIDKKIKNHDKSTYPSATEFFSNIEEFIPISLDTLLQNIICYKDKSKNKNAKNIKKNMIAHMIISATKPRSFLSPFQIGVSLSLYHRFGSKDLIEILSTLAVTCTYEEVLNYQRSLIKSQSRPMLKESGYSQFAFDNADHNVCTIDGRNTFHYMGGIQIVTPEDSVINSKVERITNLKSKDICDIGSVFIQKFTKHPNMSMNEITFDKIGGYDLKESRFVTDIELCNADFLWLCGKHINFINTPGWNAFKESFTKTCTGYKLSRVICLPFVRAPPSNLNTIYTCLITAVELASAMNQKHVFVTFDQPLYLKALEVLNSSDDPRLKKITLRLGGFHMIMSYLGNV